MDLKKIKLKTKIGVPIPRRCKAVLWRPSAPIGTPTVFLGVMLWQRLLI